MTMPWPSARITRNALTRSTLEMLSKVRKVEGTCTAKKITTNRSSSHLDSLMRYFTIVDYASCLFLRL